MDPRGVIQIKWMDGRLGRNLQEEYLKDERVKISQQESRLSDEQFGITFIETVKQGGKL